MQTKRNTRENTGNKGCHPPRLRVYAFDAKENSCKPKDQSMQDQGSSSLKRRLHIVDLARKEGEVRIDALSAQLRVSSVTIRNDLIYLEQQGYLIRSVGKARYNPTLLGAGLEHSGPEQAARAAVATQLAGAMVRSIADGMSVFFGGGALVHRILPQLVARNALVLSLHDLSMVATARQFLDCEIHVTGGVHHGGEAGLIGPAAETALRSQPLDLCVFEACAIDTGGRVLGRHAGSARLYAAAVRHAGRALALAHSPALTALPGHVICGLDELHELTIDHAAAPGIFELLAGHRLTLARRTDALLEFVKAE